LGSCLTANDAIPNHHFIKLPKIIPSLKQINLVSCYICGCPKPESKTLTLTITNKSLKIIPSFTFYTIHSHIRSSHHSTQTTFLGPSLGSQTSANHTISNHHFIHLKIIPSFTQINLVSCYI
jgi:hypothetical protein